MSRPPHLETYEPDPDDWAEDDGGMVDCGLGPDGCDQAGTEYCDWECPYSQ